MGINLGAFSKRNYPSYKPPKYPFLECPLDYILEDFDSDPQNWGGGRGAAWDKRDLVKVWATIYL